MSSLTHPHPWLATADDLARFIRAFEDGTLPPNHWSHAAHVAAAAHYLAHHSKSEALEILRNRIEAYNQVVGATGNGRGYHETLTVFWVGVIANFIDKERHQRPASPVADLVASAMARFGTAQKLPSDLYSFPIVASVHARAEWVAPDIWNGLRLR
jgi:hypothetical protein